MAGRDRETMEPVSHPDWYDVRERRPRGRK